MNSSDVPGKNHNSSEPGIYSKCLGGPICCHVSNVKLFCFQANFPVINGWWAGPVCLSVCTWGSWLRCSLQDGLDWTELTRSHHSLLSTLWLSEWALSSEKGVSQSVIAHPHSPPSSHHTDDHPSLNPPAPARPFLLSSRPFVELLWMLELLGLQRRLQMSMMTAQVWMRIVLSLKIILIYFSRI